MPEKPTLLLVSQSYAPRENQKKLWALAEHFDLVCVTTNEVKNMGMVVRLSDCQEERPFKLIGLDPVGDPNSTTKFVFLGLEKVIREHPADIILVETEPWALLRWQTWLLQRKHQPKALFVEYSAEDLDRTGWKGALLHQIYRAAIATSDFVVAITERGAALFRNRGAGKRLLVNPQLGIDEQLFSPALPGKKNTLRETLGIARGEFVIGFAGRYVEEKGVNDLIAAVELARSKITSSPIKLLMLGRGPLGQELIELQKERSWLQLLPTRRHHEMAEFMQALDLFVLPSKTLRAGGVTWAEQLGHVLIEATACGTPSLGSTCGEIPNVIASTEAIFPEGNVSALAERLIYWITHPAELTELGKRQRARTIANYSNAALARKLSDCLKGRLAAEKRSVLWSTRT